MFGFGKVKATETAPEPQEASAPPAAAAFIDQVQAAKKKVTDLQTKVKTCGERADLIAKNHDALRLADRDPLEETRKVAAEVRAAGSDLSAARADLHQLLSRGRAWMEKEQQTRWANCYANSVSMYEVDLSELATEIKGIAARLSSLKSAAVAGAASDVAGFDGKVAQFNRVVKDAGGSHALFFSENPLASTLANAITSIDRKAAIGRLLEGAKVALGEVSSEARARALIQQALGEISRGYNVRDNR